MLYHSGIGGDNLEKFQVLTSFSEDCRFYLTVPGRRRASPGQWDPLPCGLEYVIQVLLFFFSSRIFFGNPVSGCQTSPTSILLPSTKAIAIANLSPESCQSVFSTSPDLTFPPTPSSSPPLLSQPCVRPASVSIGFPTPPDSAVWEVKHRVELTHPLARRKIFDFPSILSEKSLVPPLLLHSSTTFPHSIFRRHQLQVTSL